MNYEQLKWHQANRQRQTLVNCIIEQSSETEWMKTVASAVWPVNINLLLLLLVLLLFLRLDRAKGVMCSALPKCISPSTMAKWMFLLPRLHVCLCAAGTVKTSQVCSLTAPYTLSLSFLCCLINNTMKQTHCLNVYDRVLLQGGVHFSEETLASPVFAAFGVLTSFWEKSGALPSFLSPNCCFLLATASLSNYQPILGPESDKL